MVPILVVFLLLPGCEKNDNNLTSFLTARIEGFDPGCSRCILEFPDDSLLVVKELGPSPENFYQAVNLDKGNYLTGQRLKVKVRNAETNEMNECRIQNPSNNFKEVFVTDFEDFEDLTINDTVLLSYKNCLNNPVDHWYICFNGVLEDSRCPKEVVCFWEGNARAEFKFERYDSKPLIFKLNTHLGFTHDTIIDNYKFTLFEVSPYPSVKRQTKPDEYKVRIVAEKLHN